MFNLFRDNANMDVKIAKLEAKISTLENEVKLLMTHSAKADANIAVMGKALTEQGPKALKSHFKVDDRGYMTFRSVLAKGVTE